MRISYDDKGIKISKLFKTQEISYSDIKSVVLLNDEYIVTTKIGEVVKYKEGLFCNHNPLYKAFKEFNICFRNDDESDEEVYSIDEINEKVKENQAYAKEFAGNLIKQELGAEYDIETKISDEGEYITMYFYLTKNGEIVKDIPKDVMAGGSDGGPYAFDEYVVAYLLEWNGYGGYGITKEVKDKVACD